MNVSWTIRGAEAVRQDVAGEARPDVARPRRLRGLDVVHLAEDEHRGPDDPRRPRRVDGGERDHRVRGRGPDAPHDADGEEDGRERHQRVHDADEPGVDPPEVPGDGAQDRAGHSRQEDHARADRDGQPGPVDHPAQEVSPEVVGAERTGPRAR